MCDHYRHQYDVDFISAMPTNLYGPEDNFNLETSHVLPALIRKVHEAKINNDGSVEIWGTGSPLREFLYVDDLANGLLFLMNNYSEKGHVNIGTGTDVTIKDLAEIIMNAIGFDGSLEFDTSKPDGTPRKVLDVGKINKMGWVAKTALEEGIHFTYRWFLDNKDRIYNTQVFYILQIKTL